ncbi:MAG: hypothetical protein NFCOHLIN_00995 [Gammaproteobacteria bacterium]|nr:hypothetical protein [Gammaproteobacteria bacterium]
MNTGTTPDEAMAGDSSDVTSSVAEYLRRHREFFVEHPELLTDLVIPHETGKAVSLVEKQVILLRDENRQLKSRFRELVNIARENEELSRRMHRLTLRLVEAGSCAQILGSLGNSLQADFAADGITLRVFADPVAAEDVDRPEFAGARSPLRTMFAEALAQRKPYCGRLKHNQQEALFGIRHEEGSEEFGSAAVLPLSGKHWEGILVIASRDPRRYHPEMGIDLLAHLGDIVSLILNPWVAAPAT